MHTPHVTPRRLSCTARPHKVEYGKLGAGSRIAYSYMYSPAYFRRSVLVLQRQLI